MQDDEIRSYFIRQKKIQVLNKQIATLNTQKEKIQNDIKEDNIFLISKVSSIRLDDVGSSTGKKNSEQERAIDRAFDELEKKIINLELEIMNLEFELSNTRKDNIKIKNFFELLSEEELKIVQLKYGERKTVNFISIKLDMSVSSVYRTYNKIIKKFIDYQQYFYVDVNN